MGMSGSRVRMHDIGEPVCATTAGLEVMQDKAASHFQRAVRFANDLRPCVAVKMMAAVGDQNSVQNIVVEQAFCC